MTLEEFVRENRHADVSSLALRMRQFPELDAAFALQQIEGWQRAEQKLPELAAIPGWLWPKRLSLEQCSSQVTALYKKAVLEKWKMENGKWKIGGCLVDLTGGLGVDTYYLSEGFDEIHYVERQQDLCALAEHNFALTSKPIHVHCCSAEEYLEKLDSADRANKPHSAHGAYKPEETTIFMDPARRDSHGGKVFRLEDCEPNAVALLSILRAHARRILLKLSPMLDLTEAIRALGGAAEIHVVAVRNEVKEVLVLLETGRDNPDPEITCVNLETDDETFSFRRSEEEATNRANWANEANSANWANEELTLIEPNAAIIKAGAFRTFAERYGLQKLDTNSHLYVLSKDSRSTQESSELLSKTWPCSMPTVPSSMRDRSETVRKRAALFDRIPGRIFTVRIATKNELKNLKQANVICRNYPMTPDALKKKLHLKDGGQTYLIGTQIAGKTTLFLGTRQFLHT